MPTYLTRKDPIWNVNFRFLPRHPPAFLSIDFMMKWYHFSLPNLPSPPFDLKFRAGSAIRFLNVENLEVVEIHLDTVFNVRNIFGDPLRPARGNLHTCNASYLKYIFHCFVLQFQSANFKGTSLFTPDDHSHKRNGHLLLFLTSSGLSWTFHGA